MDVEIKKLEIIRDLEKGKFEVKLDGIPINGVKGYELKSLPDGEPELKLILNVADFEVSFI